MREWEFLFDNAMAQVKAANIPDTTWTFGGGTSLMLKFNHRHSKDIDIFVSSPQLLSSLSPRLNDAIDSMVGRYDEQSNFVRVYLHKGEIDFIHSRQVSSLNPSREIIRGVALNVDSPIEVIAKKIFYRSGEFKSRDVFDLAVVYSKQKFRMANLAKIVEPQLEVLEMRVSELIASGQLENDCSNLELLEYGKSIRGREAELYHSFISDMKQELTRLETTKQVEQDKSISRGLVL